MSHWQGDKNIIKFEGDHNSSRPQFYYDSVTIFFHNVLGPPAEETCNFLAYDLNAFPPIQGLVEVLTSLLYIVFKLFVLGV